MHHAKLHTPWQKNTLEKILRQEMCKKIVKIFIYATHSKYIRKGTFRPQTQTAGDLLVIRTPVTRIRFCNENGESPDGQTPNSAFDTTSSIKFVKTLLFA